MTDEAAARYPAPGSPVPGAPPPLKRALTPADGATVGPQGTPPEEAAHQANSRPPTAGAGSGVGERGAPVRAPRLTAAAAMVGIAAGLELAGVLARRSKGVKC
ncbi:hypothetical protein NIIDNTM18_19120 [Mycolicibacterium litorale]|uniref:Uncharacterized protein n=1 Tax=Mycolicibacterium litorale TaxID=758802 RepID=A0A6S6P1K1_9MYCO|nr:hypothetical protein NIIDNTM18_19120 [Mycolicibacterium litorale]